SQRREPATKSISRRWDVLGYLEGRLFRLLKSKRKPLPEAEIIREIYGLEQDRKSSNRLRQLQCAVNAKLRRSKTKVQIVRPQRGLLCLKGKMKRTRPWNDEQALERVLQSLDLRLERERSQNDHSASAAPRPRQALAGCREFLASTYPHGGEFESRK